MLKQTKFTELIPKLKLRNCLIIALGNVILSFGLYQIHAQTHVTEGGVLGMTLLLKYWFDISPAYSGFVLDLICYAIGLKVLGKEFLGYSVVASFIFSLAYRIFEMFPPLWPEMYQAPAAAALIGALFVGVGVGISVRAGGATGGDDALAMSLAKVTKKEIQWMYLITDVTVLALSLSYIPVKRIVWSLVTVVLSGQIIGWIQKIPAGQDSPRHKGNQNRKQRKGETEA